MKKVIALALALTMVLGLASCTTGKPSSSGENQSSGNAGSTNGTEPVTIKVSINIAKTFTIVQELYAMAERVRDRTNGQLNIEIYEASVLGSDSEVYEQVMAGTIDSMCYTIAGQASIHPEFNIEDLPFPFADRDTAYAALDGEYGQAITDIIEADGELKNLGFVEMGFRSISNSKNPITRPEDMKGLKIGTANSALRVAVFEALGAQPVTMAWSEVFSALQQKVLDGYECPMTTMDSSSFPDVQKYCTVTGHFWTNYCFIINANSWKSIPAENQAIFQEEVNTLVANVREQNIKDDASLVASLTEQGMEVTEDFDRDAFITAVQPVIDEWKDKFGTLYEVYARNSGY